MKFKFKQFKMLRRQKHLILLLVFLFVLGFFIPEIALADVGKAVAQIISSAVINMVNFFAGWILTFLIQALISVAQYNDFIGSAAVSKGWIIIRDIFNMFFVVILLVIAFATVLKIERYHYKRLLAGFLIAAVMVNFSKLICGIIIDFAQILMLTFVNAFKYVASGNFIDMLGLTKLLAIGSSESVEVSGATIIGATLLGLIMAIVATVVIGVIVIILVFRIVMLWFLVVLSPLAFMATVLPFTQGYARQWWEKFGKQVIIGPILAFFLWLSLAVVHQGGIIEDVKMDKYKAEGAKLSPEEERITEASSPQFMLNFIIGIGMLVGSLMMAQQMGVAGGRLAGSAVGKMQGIASGIAKAPLKPLKWAGKGVKYGAKAGVKELESKIGIPLTKDKWKQVFKDRQEWIAEKRDAEFVKKPKKKGLLRYMPRGDMLYKSMTWKGGISAAKRIKLGLAGRADQARDEANKFEEDIRKQDKELKAKTSESEQDELKDDAERAGRDLRGAEQDIQGFGPEGKMRLPVVENLLRLLIKQNKRLKKSDDPEDKKQAEKNDDLIKDIKLAKTKAEDNALKQGKKPEQGVITTGDLRSVNQDFYKGNAREFLNKQKNDAEKHKQELDLKLQEIEFSETDQLRVNNNLGDLRARIKDIDIDESARDELEIQLTNLMGLMDKPFEDLTKEQRKKMADSFWLIQGKLRGLEEDEKIHGEDAEIMLDLTKDSHSRLSKEVITDDDMLEMAEGIKETQGKALDLRADAEIIDPTVMTPEQREASHRRVYREYEKLKYVDSVEELETLYAKAEKEKDSDLARAVITKLNDNGDTNELLKTYGYKQGSVGMGEFAKERLSKTGKDGKFDLSEQEAFMFMNDLGAQNKLRGRYRFMSPVNRNLKTGLWEQTSAKELERIELIESGKKSAAALLDGSWMGIFTKHEDPVTGERVPLYDAVVEDIFKRSLGNIHYKGIKRGGLQPEIEKNFSHPDVMASLEQLSSEFTDEDLEKFDDVMTYLKGAQARNWG